MLCREVGRRSYLLVALHIISSGRAISHTYRYQKFPAQFTPHCNDDLNIINEQGNPMVNLSNLVLWQCKIAIFEIISPALLEILVGMHSPFCPIWRIFLPVYNRPSKRAGDLILKMAILHCQSTKLLELTIGILCSFIMLRSSLQ